MTSHGETRQWIRQFVEAALSPEDLDRLDRLVAARSAGPPERRDDDGGLSELSDSDREQLDIERFLASRLAPEAMRYLGELVSQLDRGADEKAHTEAFVDMAAEARRRRSKENTMSYGQQGDWGPLRVGGTVRPTTLLRATRANDQGVATRAGLRPNATEAAPPRISSDQEAAECADLRGKLRAAGIPVGDYGGVEPLRHLWSVHLGGDRATPGGARFDQRYPGLRDRIATGGGGYATAPASGLPANLGRRADARPRGLDWQGREGSPEVRGGVGGSRALRGEDRRIAHDSRAASFDQRFPGLRARITVL